MRGEGREARCEKTGFFAKAIVCLLLIFLASRFSPLASVSAQAETLTLSADACAAATAHAPDADVTYRPGVDVHGKPVVPADVAGSGTMPWPQDLEIPLSLNLQNALRLSNKLTGSDAHIGTIRYQNGRFTFNGEPIGADAQADLIAACRASR